jgi:hypothetical protein
LRRRSYEAAIETNALVGTPASVAARIKALPSEIGLCCILAALNCGGLIPHRNVLNALPLLCEAVKPLFPT